MDRQKVKVMKIRVDENGPTLLLREIEKDQLWHYCEDWIGKIEIRFLTMSEEEISALPEFEGF